MKLVLLDGTFGDGCLNARQVIETKYRALEYDITSYKLEDMTIAYCTGCWSCWMRTPGLCIHKDDTYLMLKSVINADLVIHFSENTLGFVTSLSKKALDKFVPLVHPYIVLDHGECHHVKRYDHYPEFGLVFVDNVYDTEDFIKTKEIFKRAALNFKSSLSMSVMVNRDGKELAHESNLL